MTYMNLPNTLKIKFSDRALQNQILQRTRGYLQLPNHGNGFAQWQLTGNKEALLPNLKNSENLNSFYQETIKDYNQEAQIIKKILNEQQAGKFCSIGCGNGILEFFLYHLFHYEQILLIDIEESSHHKHDYQENSAGYCNLEDTKMFLIGNGINENIILTCNPNKQALPQQDFNVIISTLSMGFHYPIKQYVEFIDKNLQINGYLIFDNRKNTNDKDWQFMQPKFKLIHEIDNKYSFRQFYQRII